MMLGTSIFDNSYHFLDFGGALGKIFMGKFAKWEIFCDFAPQGKKDVIQVLKTD